MTLPELIRLAESLSRGQSGLSRGEEEYLMHLLREYAREVMNPGQTLKEKGISIKVTSTGRVFVVLEGGKIGQEESSA